jgi:hypothetical protein
MATAGPPSVGPTIPDWLSGLGAVVGTCLTIYAIVRGAWKRPRLSMATDLGTAPNSDQIEADDPWGFKAENVIALVRARIIAKRSTAKDAKVVIRKASVTNTSASRPIHVAGSLLTWSGTNAVTTQFTVERDHSPCVNIVSVRRALTGDEAPLLIAISDASNKERRVARGMLTLEVTVTSSNGPPSYYAVTLAYDGVWPAAQPIWGHLTVTSLERQRRLRSLLRV